MKKLLFQLGLGTWYEETFTAAERAAMEVKADFSGCGYNGTPSGFLADLSAYFNTKAEHGICARIMKKAEELPLPDEIMAQHFFFMHMINFYYKNRDQEGYMEKAVEYCKKQIAIAPEAAVLFRNDSPYLPSHTGYEQLAIIEKKNKNWQAVVDLCTQAKSQGWGGDWDKRIEEAQKKL